METLWLIIFLLLIPLFMIAMSLVLIFKKDWAWGIVKTMLGHLNPERTLRWEEGTTVNGVLLIVGGLGIGLYLLIKLPPLLQRW